MRCLRPLGMVLVVMLGAGAGWGQEVPAVRVRPSAQGGAPTDAAVLAAIQRGVDLLLNAKKGDNWETHQPNDPQYPNYGGHTAAALYALLHVGKSLEDPRLDAKSPELAPAVKWLAELDLRGTYTAGFMANALGLVPGEKPEKMKGLATCRDYLMAAMGSGGGYSYSRRLEEPEKFQKAFEEYVKIKTGGGNPVAVDKAKEAAMQATHYARYYFGGLELWCRLYMAELKEQSRKDPASKARNDVLMAELDKFRVELRQAETTKDVPNWKSMVAKYQENLRTGKYGTTTDRDKNVIPKTKEDVEKDIAIYKELIARATSEKPVIGISPSGDLSNGQYGTLGAWGLEDAHVELPEFYWTVSDHFWRSTQQAGGTWPYNPVNGGEGTPTMTVAGIASLFVTADYFDRELRLVPQPDKHIAAGLAWLNANYATATAQYKELYYLYGCERVGLASGLKFFGEIDWYRQGATTLLAQQKKTGEWLYNDATIGTAYALLFLARGRNPLVFSKLEYNGYWNARPRDVAHVTEWMSKEAEKPMNWQVVDLRHSAEEWADAPVLVITGSQDPKFSAADLGKIKAFVESGGVVFSSADGGADAFTAAMRKYAAKICDNKFEMRQLPADHVIFSKDCWQPVLKPPTMLGLSNGMRELWIHSPQDMGASWQTRKLTAKEHFQIPADVCFYATGGKKLMRSRLQPLAVTVTPGGTDHKVTLARVQYDEGNWNPEPGAWKRMVKLAAADYKLDLQLSEAALDDLDKLDGKAVPIVHLTGTTRFRATPERAKVLRAYLDKGGMLFVDAVGGSKDLVQSALELLKQAYPEGDSAPSSLPMNHPIYSGVVADSDKITEVEYRKLAKMKLNAGSSPRLRGLVRDGKLKVVLSEEDLTSGLLGTNTMGILGYTADSSESLVANVLLYAAEQPAAALPAEATTKPIKASQTN